MTNNTTVFPIITNIIPTQTTLLCARGSCILTCDEFPVFKFRLGNYTYHPGAPPERFFRSARAQCHHGWRTVLYARSQILSCPTVWSCPRVPWLDTCRYFIFGDSGGCSFVVLLSLAATACSSNCHDHRHRRMYVVCYECWLADQDWDADSAARSVAFAAFTGKRPMYDRCKLCHNAGRRGSSAGAERCGLGFLLFRPRQASAARLQSQAFSGPDSDLPCHSYGCSCRPARGGQA